MGDSAWRSEVVKRSAQAKGFKIIPRRWVVERTPRLNESLPAPGQGLRKPQPDRHRLHATGEHQAHAQKDHSSLLSFINFPGGL